MVLRKKKRGGETGEKGREKKAGIFLPGRNWFQRRIGIATDTNARRILNMILTSPLGEGRSLPVKKKESLSTFYF